MKSNQVLLWFPAIAVLLIPGCSAAEFCDDFANNLFTDLAPLIALFGERVTMQYMSQATGWADSFTLVVRECKDISIETLIELGASLEARSDGGATPLMIACRLGRIKSVQKLIGFGADTNTVTDTGSSILLEAAWIGQRKVVEHLLKTGVDKGSQNYAGWTALHCAAMCGRRKIVQSLTDAGADKNKPDYSGMTPLHHAVSCVDSAVTKVLLMAGADKEAKDSNGMTALHHVAGEGTSMYTGAVKGAMFGTVIENGSEVSDQARERILRLLLEDGADKHSVNHEGKTARQLAEEAGKQSRMDILDMF